MAVLSGAIGLTNTRPSPVMRFAYEPWTLWGLAAFMASRVHNLLKGQNYQQPNKAAQVGHRPKRLIVPTRRLNLKNDR